MSLRKAQERAARAMRYALVPRPVLGVISSVGNRDTHREISVTHGGAAVIVDCTGDPTDYVVGSEMYMYPISDGRYRSYGVGTYSAGASTQVPRIRTDVINTPGSSFAVNVGGADGGAATTTFGYDSGSGEWRHDTHKLLSEDVFTGKGNLLTSSAADTLSILSVGGTDGSVLTESSGAAGGLAWSSVLKVTSTAVTVNDAGADVNFRLEGDTDTNLIVADAGEDAVAIGGVIGANQKLTVHAGHMAFVPLVVKGAASQAVDLVKVLDSSNNEWFSIGISDLIINEAGADRDFRVEGSGNANLILADAGSDVVSIGGAATASQLAVYGETYITGTKTNGYALIVSTAITSNTHTAIMQAQANMTPTAADLYFYGQIFLPTLYNSATALTAAQALYCRVDTNANYTGNVTDVRGLTIADMSHSGSGAVTTQSQVYIDRPTKGITNYAIFSAGGQSQLLAGVATITPLVLKAAASQTANIQDWQNSAGTALFEVEASGELDFRWAMGDSALDPTSDAPADWVQVKISGTSYYLPAYAAS